MRTKRYVAILVVFGAIGIITTGPVQYGAAEEKEKSFFNQLDDFGKSIFGGILPSKKSKAKSQETAEAEKGSSDRRQKLSDPVDEADAPRAGSVLEGKGKRPSDNRKSTEPKYEYEYAPDTMPPVYERGEDGLPKRVRRPHAAKSLLDGDEAPAKPSIKVAAEPRRVAAEPPRKTVAAQEDFFGEQPDLAERAKPAAKPLHQRMAGFNRSVFDTDAKKDRRPQSDLQPKRAAELAPIEQDVVSEPETPRATGRPLIAERQPLEARTEGVPPPARLSTGEKSPDADDARDVRDVKQPREQGSVLFSRKGPDLSVETFGPRTISVGRESTYEVHIINSGSVAAEELVVYVSLPEWAEIARAEAGAGGAKAAEIIQKDGTVRWNVGSLNAKGRERLTLKIIPRQSRPFDLAVRWDYKPIASQASIEVQEPKLAIQLEGPKEVFYGKKELFKLHLANTGTGDAENVVLTLIPIGAGENVQAMHKIELLPAGEKKTLEVELTARQAGNLSIQVDARADGNLRAELAEKVLVRRAGMKLNLDGPKVQFVGAVANYIVTAVNPGNAPARNVKFELTLPAGAKYLSGIEGARLDESGDKLVWSLETLEPQKEQRFTLKCRLAATGMSRVRLSVVADDDLTAQAETVVRVEAVADLTMEVKDPTGPIPIGEEVVYEVRVRNRGTKEAQNVEVFAYFSRGIEPLSAEGGESRLGPGQVIFQPLASLAPEAEVVLKIRAKAGAAGNHIFRAETHCKPLSARLISEATNLYYGDAPAAEQTAREPSTNSPTR